MRTGRETRSRALFAAGLLVCAGLLLAAALAPAERTLTVFTVSTGAYLAFCLAAAVWMAARRVPPERQFALLTLLFGAAYLLLITPLSVPDEDHHYRVACDLSNLLLFRWDQVTLVPAGYLDYTGLTAHSNTSAGLLRVLTGLFAPLSAGGMAVAEASLPWGYYLPYLPQTLGLTLARLLRLGFVGAFLLGRGCNLLFYSGCVGWAVRRAPRYKTALGIAGLLPMAAQQAASWSYDAFINGMALCFFAQLLGCLYEEGRLPRRDYLTLLALAVLLAPARGIYAPLLALVLLIPRTRFSGPGRKWARLGWLLVCAALAAALFLLPGVQAVGEAGDGLNWEGGHNYTLTFVREHPLAAARIFADTIRRYLGGWVSTMVGGTLSGLTLKLPRVLVWAWTLTLFLSGSGLAGEGPLLRPGPRLAFLAAAAGGGLLCMGVMFLSWTSETRALIQGVQGRYFLPMAAPAAMALGLPLRRRNGDLAAVFPPAAAVLHCAVLAFVLAYTLRH